MTILQSLAKAYDRLSAKGEAPPFGYSSQQISFLIVLDEDGQVIGTPIDLRVGTGRKLAGRSLFVPQSFKRPGITPRPFFLWDNTTFALGVPPEPKAGEPAKDARTNHAVFVKNNIMAIKYAQSTELIAFRHFLENWLPEKFEILDWPKEMKGINVCFSLSNRYLTGEFIHNCSEARKIWRKIGRQWCDAKFSNDGAQKICLVLGEKAEISRIHPPIRGIRAKGAAKDSDSIVSFNKPAFESYGHEQGDNAPVSEAAAAAYTSVLNKFLARGSRNRIQIGDASTVFWADCEEANRAAEAEAFFSLALGGEEPKFDEAAEEKDRLLPMLDALREGRPIAVRPELAAGIRFHVLGLAPNAARLSVRYWFDDEFGVIATRLGRHAEAMRIEPPPRKVPTPLWMCLTELAPQGKTENVPPNLAGEWLRAILSGAPYPLTLQSTLLMRLRADKSVDALRAAILKAGLITRGKKVPVSFDPDNKDRGYLLGRLFATYEQVQSAAHGGSVNATIRDKFYAAASATPRKVFPVLDRGSANHLGKLRRDKPGYAVVLEKQIGAIMTVFDPAGDPFPTALNADEQSLFAVGYYHQKNEFFRKKDEGSSEAVTETGSH